jgi:Undecaprenyl-phosphate galactose phosphotransferase WbaP
MAANHLIFPSAIALSKPALSFPWATPTCLVSADLLALSLVYWIAVLGRSAVGGPLDLSFYLELYPAVTLFLAGFFVQDLYPGCLLHPAEEIRRVFRCVTTVFLLIASSTFLWHNADRYSRGVFLIMWAMSAPCVLLARNSTRDLFSAKPWWGVPAIVLGSGAAARRVIQTASLNRCGLRIAGVLSNSEPRFWPSDLPPLLGQLDAGPKIAHSGIAQYAIVAMPHGTNDELRQTIQDHCVGFRHVLLIPDLPGLCSLHISAREIGGEVALDIPQRLFHPGAALAKRVTDVVGSGSVMLLLLPLLAVVSILIRLTSTGPIFFGHRRFGRDGGTFAALKFRTMVPNGDQVLQRHLEANPAAREEWDRDQKLKDDPRVTYLGKWLRRCSLDELPQLWNVLVGEMSLVGPRPIVKSETKRYGRAYGLYTRVLPGITGLWQVSGRNNTSYDERIAFDEYYVRNWSVWLDTYILGRTIRTVLTGDGAY